MTMKKKAFIAIATAFAAFVLVGCFGKNGAAEKKEANEKAPKEFAQDDGIDEWLMDTEANGTAPVESSANENTAKSKDIFALIRTARRHSTYDIEKLLAAGADVNAKDKDDRSALIYAADDNAIDVAQLLIKSGADVNAKDEDGKSALIYAADDNAIDMAQLLIKSSADVNAKMDSKPRPLSSGWIGAGWVDSYQMIDDWTALMLAAYRNAADVARLLIKAGADVNTKTNEGKTALTLAFEAEADMNREKPTPIKYEVIDVLKAAGAKE